MSASVNSIPGSHDSPTWYVMRHLDMKRFKVWLDKKNIERLQTNRALIEPFYPYDYLSGRRSTSLERTLTSAEKAFARLKGDTKKQVNGLQTKVVVAETHHDFYDIVFLKATGEDIASLVEDPWNRDFRVRLRYLIDTATGKPARVSDVVMDKFYDNCVKYRGYFGLCPTIDGIEKKDRVEIKTGVFAGHEAFVVKVRHGKGGLRLELAVQLVSGIMNITMTDVRPHDVVVLNKSSVDAIRADFIEHIQNRLLTIYEHRVKTVNDAQTRLRDMTTLHSLYRYHTYEVEGHAARTHFKALMLICAHLRKDAEGEEALRQEALGLLADMNRQSESKAATDIRTWLWIALYISTAAPAYRDAAKQYVRDKQPKSQKLRRFVSLMRIGKKA